MAFLKSFSLDEKKDSEGIWYPYMGDCELKIARIGNPRYTEYISTNKKVKKILSRNRSSLSEEDTNTILVHAVSKYILLDWKNVLGDDGAELKYTPERGMEILKDPKFKLFLEFIIECANDIEEYLVDEVGNSQGSSNGPSPIQPTQPILKE